MEFDLQQYLLILKARIKVFAIAVGSCFLLAAIYTFSLPTTYTASTTLNFDVTSGNQFMDSRNIYARVGDYITTQIDIITSMKVAQKVAETFSPQEEALYQEAQEADRSAVRDLMNFPKRMIRRSARYVSSLFAPEPRHAATSVQDEEEGIDLGAPEYSPIAGSLLGDLSVQPGYQTRIVTISYTSTDPMVAALVANRFAEAYMVMNLEMTTNPAERTKEWFDGQLKVLRANYEEAQARLTQYTQEAGIVATSERMDLEDTRLAQMTHELVTAQIAVREAQTQQQQMEELQAKGESLLVLPGVTGNATVQSLRADIRGLEAKRLDLSSSLGLNHPKIQLINAEIQEAEERLNKELASVADSIRTNVRLAREKEQSERQALNAQKELVLRLRREHDNIAVLERDVESAQNTYNEALRQFNTSRLQSVVDQTNVSIVDKALPPYGPSGPNSVKDLVLGLMAGFALGLGLVVLLELIDRRVRSKADVVRGLNVPLLGAVSEIRLPSPV